ncbi:MAG: S8 family peptidase [Lentimicrobiaceae bacterium]|nr:S8 family peptidase [Lentimicrobiaceae bacterium]
MKKVTYYKLRKLFSACCFLLFVFNFLSSALFAQTDFYYTTNGKKESFKIRKDMVIFKCQSETDIDVFLGQSFFTMSNSFNDNLIIATIDTLKMKFDKLKQTPTIMDITYALEYADGTILLPTNDIVIQMKVGKSIEEVFDYIGLGDKIIRTTLENKYQEIYVVSLDVSLENILQISRNLYETGWCELAAPSFFVKMKQHNAPPPETNPHYPLQWGLKNTGQMGEWCVPGIDINVEPAWDITKGSMDIKIAVLDVGVQLDHPDLEDNLLPGCDVTYGAPGGENGSYSGTDAHGTYCAGIIGAVDNDKGIIGVAPNCKIIPVRVGYKTKARYDEPNNVWTNDEWLSFGIRHAWEDFGADVLSCSWGGGPELPLTNAAITNAITLGRNGKGCVIVASSGNYLDFNQPIYVEWPANLPTVLAVGSIFCNGGRALNSCFSSTLDVVAPGVEICTTTINDSYDYITGTSAACPHVAGVAALILSVNPCLSYEEVKKTIALSCKKIHTTDVDGRQLYVYTYSPIQEYGTWDNQMGYGLVDAYKAVCYATAQNQIHTFKVSGVDMGITDSLFLQIENEEYLEYEDDSWSPNPVDDGIYLVNRHEIRATVSYTYTLSPIVQGIANGFSSTTNTNNGRYFMEVVALSETEATVRTYFYEVIQTISGTPQQWIPSHPDSVRFHISVMCDTFQHKLYLQNEIESGTKSYNVITHILAGKNVNPDEVFGNYTIQSKASVSLHAGEKIVLSDGFTASAGSHFHAYVDPFFICTYTAKTLTKGETDELTPVITDYSVEKKEFQSFEETKITNELYLKLYPNPSNGDVTIEYSINETKVVEISLYDNFGKPFYILKNRAPHDSGVYKIMLTGVELPTGIYNCTLKTENNQKTEKLLILK